MKAVMPEVRLWQTVQDDQAGTERIGTDMRIIGAIDPSPIRRGNSPLPGVILEGVTCVEVVNGMRRDGLALKLDAETINVKLSAKYSFRDALDAIKIGTEIGVSAEGKFLSAGRIIDIKFIDPKKPGERHGAELVGCCRYGDTK